MNNYSDELKEKYFEAIDRVSDLIQNRDQFSPGTFFVKVNNRLKNSRHRVEILFWLANTLYSGGLKILVYRVENDVKANLIVAPSGANDRQISLCKIKIDELKCLRLLGTTDFIYSPENDRECRLILLTTFLETPWLFTINKIKEDFRKRMVDITIAQI